MLKQVPAHNKGVPEFEQAESSAQIAKARELFLEYAEGRLSESEREAVSAHLEGCPPCVEFLRSYRETPRIAREATASRMPPEVADRLKRFLGGMK